MSNTVLVTGGAVRLGRGITEYFLKQNWRVAVHYHKSKKQAKQLKEANQVSLHRADLASRNGLDHLVQSIQNQYDHLNGLINNAGIFREASLDEIDEEDWATPFEINARAPFELSRRLSPLLKPVNGAIVQITDAALRRPYSDYLPYFASKGALHTITKGLARALGPEIRVNAVAPGPIEFPPDIDETEEKAIIQKTILERQGTREEVAQTAYFLLAQATYTTGEYLRVDGGRNLN